MTTSSGVIILEPNELQELHPQEVQWWRCSGMEKQHPQLHEHLKTVFQQRLTNLTLQTCSGRWEHLRPTTNPMVAYPFARGSSQVHFLWINVVP